MSKPNPCRSTSIVDTGESKRIRLFSRLSAAVVAAAVLPSLWFIACASTVERQAQPESVGSVASGSGGAFPQARDASLHPIVNGASGLGGDAAMVSVLGVPAAVEIAEVIEPIADPGPLLCTAPDRESYKAAHQTDAGDESPDAAVSDLDASSAMFDLENGGMEHTVLFIFDKSGSMTTNWDGRNKWQVAADTMIASVSPFQDYLSAGAIFFPTDDNCGVAAIESEKQIDFRLGSDFLAAWETSMSGSSPNGATPMSVAFRQADQAIARACQLGVLVRPFKVAVLTDGEPNCDGDPEVLTSLPAKWNQHGIKTYVIGLPGSEPASALLEAIAQAGGTETYFSPSEPDELEDQMTVICM
jgi:hypothetical protein